MRAALLGCMLLAACDDNALPPKPPPIDHCDGLSEVKLEAVPPLVHVNAPVALTASGGSGHYSYSAAVGGSNGELREGRFIAGPTPATDTLTVIDDCGNEATTTVEVRGAFYVAPSRATVKPATAFTITVSGALGTARFTAQALGSGGSLSATGNYVAGATNGLDLITVEDTGTGEQVLLQYAVSASAQLRAVPPKLGIPAGAQAPLGVANGSGQVTWSKLSGPGSVMGNTFISAAGDTGTAQLEGVDRYTGEKTSVTVRILEELKREGRPHGHLTDVASVVTGDFDGDGFADVAVGIAESDLSFPSGGAVFIYKGSAAGLPSMATWTLLGESDTAQLGAVMAAGDLDGDGRDDLAVSAPGADVTGGDSGVVQLYLFTSAGPKKMRSDLSGVARGGNFGAALAIFDVNSDGIKDLVVTSPLADLAPTAQISSRGVVDVFLGQRGGGIADQSAFRLGGWDLAPDKTFKATHNLRFGRSLAVGDFDGDGLADLAFNGVTSAPLPDGGSPNRTQPAVAVHFARVTAPRFVEKPDLYVLPVNFADGDEGTLRLGYVPKELDHPAMLLTALDRADSPNLSADGGTAGGSNGGGVYLFNLTGRGPTSSPVPTAATTLERTDAYARFYGETAGWQMGRSFTLAELEDGAGLSLVVGAPYAHNPPAPTLLQTGKIAVFGLHSLPQGTVRNKAFEFRAGDRADTLGTALAAWRPAGTLGLVTVASRATTDGGDFTGRVDAFLGTGPIDAWAKTSADVPAHLASEQFGVSLETATIAGKPRVLVGAPWYSGPDQNAFGNDTSVGQTIAYEVGKGDQPLVVHEGAVGSYVRDGKQLFGGRFSGVDVALTDFNGDGRPDLAIALPGFQTPLPTNTEYAQLPLDAGCTMSPVKALGGVTVQLSQSDGTFKEGYRVWAPELINGECDGGTCLRAGLARTGIAGGFDFNNDGNEDIALTRNSGLDIFPGRPPADATLSKLTAVCGPLFTLPQHNRGTFGPMALGDLDGDGCDEVGVRYGNLNSGLVDPLVTPQGLIIVFGFDPNGACGAHTQPAYMYISGEIDVGINSVQFGYAAAAVGKVLGDNREFIAVSARLYPFEGVTQPTVLLYDKMQIAALRPAQGSALVPMRGGGLTPIPLVYKDRAPQFGRALAGNVDLTGDGIVDLVVGASRANVNGEGTGAVFVFAGGPGLSGAREPVMMFLGDHRERGNFGQDLSLSVASGPLKALLGIGAPISYRTGTANGSAFVTPLNF
ncbi:MAG: FG-GAP-like repeat-containing protein [Myxococcaceae bacterium]|nr:FG-GAP-like repeat-containing protein [Myxococcaceae bacterium]